MVRRIVYMQVMIAQRKLSMDDLCQALDKDADHSLTPSQVQNPGNRLVHGLAPAQGLILAEVNYPLEVLRINEDKELDH
jgi:tRNA U38,U39,U40 pseudouridine synthase TruA